MRYSIITPTILRPSLVRACKSLDEQTCTDWEHIVMVDSDRWNGDLLVPLMRSGRRIIQCAQPHKNFGNTCRHDAWARATGDYILYLDDDCYYADPAVLEDMKVVTKDWAIFPMSKPWIGGLYFHCPPQCGFTDAGQMLIKRKIGR